MERGRLDKAREQAVEWAEAEVRVEGLAGGTAPARGRVVIVFVPIAGRECLIRRGHLAIL